MVSKQNLAIANHNKNDEFYTRLIDIEKELEHYRKHFKGKTVYCNCDDPFESNFFKYFVLNFNRLGLKKLIATCYAAPSIAYGQLSLFDIPSGDMIKENKPYKAIVTKIYDVAGDDEIDMVDVAKLFKIGENKLTELRGDGDFRSEECLELLKEADIIVTNPPFSLFREYIAILMKYKKEFLIIGNANAISYKEFFPLLKENKVWMGVNIHSRYRKFFVPDNYPLNTTECGIYNDGRKFIKLKNVRWFTNLDHKQYHKDLILIKKYNPKEYPKYDNYDAINVDKTKDIPYDYDGVMGVPITFLDKYNPDQFEIIGLGNSRDNFMPNKDYINPKKILKDGSIKNVTAINHVLAINYKNKPNKVHYISDNSNYLIAPYVRILIRNKHPEPRKRSRKGVEND